MRLKECFDCAVELLAACLVTSIGGPVVVMCEDQVMLTDLSQAVKHISLKRVCKPALLLPADAWTAVEEAVGSYLPTANTCFG